MKKSDGTRRIRAGGETIAASMLRWTGAWFRMPTLRQASVRSS
ncbi:MAG: hypothetical protein ACT6RN_13830 [Agrobacterium sp.]